MDPCNVGFATAQHRSLTVTRAEAPAAACTHLLHKFVVVNLAIGAAGHVPGCHHLVRARAASRWDGAAAAGGGGSGGRSRRGAAAIGGDPCRQHTGNSSHGGSGQGQAVQRSAVARHVGAAPARRRRAAAPRSAPHSAAAPPRSSCCPAPLLRSALRRCGWRPAMSAAGPDRNAGCVGSDGAYQPAHAGAAGGALQLALRRSRPLKDRYGNQLRRGRRRSRPIGRVGGTAAGGPPLVPLGWCGAPRSPGAEGPLAQQGRDWLMQWRRARGGRKQTVRCSMRRYSTLEATS